MHSENKQAKTNKQKTGIVRRGDFKCVGNQRNSTRLILSFIWEFSGNQHLKSRRDFKAHSIINFI